MDPTTWNLPFLLVWLIMYGIIICRAGATYALGRLGRGGLAKSARIRALLASEKYARAEARVNRFGAPIVAASFLTIGFQTLANLAAGTTLMPWLRYLAALLVGGAAWATVYSIVASARSGSRMIARRSSLRASGSLPSSSSCWRSPGPRGGGRARGAPCRRATRTR